VARTSVVFLPSQWVQDNHLRGRLDELRIHRTALSQGELAALHAGGPDTQ